MPKLCTGTGTHNGDPKKDLAAGLAEARARTRFLLQTVSEEDLMVQ